MAMPTERRESWNLTLSHIRSWFCPVWIGLVRWILFDTAGFSSALRMKKVGVGQLPICLSQSQNLECSSRLSSGAVRNGLIEVLKETTKKDCNSKDDDGMTPTLWAAFDGNLEALRLLVARGGDPDRSDNYGNTALHFAAERGHVPCVRFLANFGANLWSLNCEMHTPKELAALNNREEVLRFLDEIMAKQELTNRKDVKAKKEKAQKEAERKLKEYDKVKKKAEKYAEKEQKRLEKEREKMGEEFANGQGGQQKGPSLVLMALKNKTGSINRGSFTPSPKFSEIVGTVTEANAKKFGMGSVQRKIQQKYGSHRGGPVGGGGDFKVIEVEDGKKSVKNLIGLRRDSEILYVGTYDKDKGQSAGKRGKLSDVFHEKKEELSGPDSVNEDDGFGDDILLQEPSSIFDRPGFGNFAFRNSITATLNALPIVPENGTKKEIVEEDSSIGSAGSLVVRQNPNNRFSRSRWSTDILSYEDGIDSLYEDENEADEDSSPLQLFLISNGLGEYIDRFLVEKVDLESLLMLTEDDLKTMEIPLGPRRKLMAAIQNRKKALQEPGQVQDSQL